MAMNFIFGREHCKGKKIVLDTRIYFSNHKKPFWFSDPFVQKFLKGVDGTEVLFEEALKDKYGHGISTQMISTGCKTLCDIYFDEEGLWFYGTAMGDNCLEYMFEIAREREVNLFYEHYPYIDSKYFEDGLVCHNGKPVTEYEFDDMYSDWCELARDGRIK